MKDYHHHNERKMKPHQELLALWQELWSEAGWEPRILTLDDAKKHPNYQQFRKDIINNGPLHENSFDYMCLMRWLAMAAQGTGGWMSDYDTFPAGITVSYGRFLPNAGKFTDYDGHVPSLLSGDAREWERISQNIIQITVKHVKDIQKHGNLFYSDMLALLHLYENSSSEYVQQQRVFKGFPYEEKDKIKCEYLKDMLAVHLSHQRTAMAIEEGILKVPDGINDYRVYIDSLRNRFTREFSDNWKQQCSTKEES